MADTAIAITAGSGTNVDTRTEATNGNHRQVIVIGDPSTNAGVAPVDATNGLAVDVKASVLPSDAATSTNQDTIIDHVDGIEALLTTIADAVDGTEVQVDIVSSAAIPVTDNAGSLTVDGTVSVTGVSTSAKQDTIIGHLDGVESLLTDIESNQLPDSHNVTVDNSTGAAAVNIQDGGNTITVDGTITANLSATDNAVLDNIDADTSAIQTATEAIQTAVEGTIDVAIVSGGGGGVQYTEGDTDASITGTAVMWEDGSDTLRAVSAAKPLPVDIQDSTIAVTQSGTWDEVGINDSGNSITVDQATAANLNAQVVGNVASAATDSGNPVKVAGVYGYASNGSPTDLTVGQRSDSQVDIKGSQRIVLMAADTPYPILGDDTGSDAYGTSGRALNVKSLTYSYNGSSWDRIRGDTTNGLDVDVTRLPALAAGTNLIGRMSASDETSTVYSGTTALTPKFAAIDAASSGDNTLVAAVNPKKIRVLSAFLVSAGTATVRFESGASGTALTGQMNLVANTGFVLPYNPVGWFETASNTLLNLELSGAISVDGSLVYVEV